MRVELVPVALLEGELLHQDPFMRLAPDGFSFTTPHGVRFAYRRGGQVRVDCPDEALADERDLYLWGTVFGTVAWLNGLMPLHCSAIAGNSGAVAFTAPSGGGKSTLAAAFAQLGHAHVCDDTLVLQFGDGAPWALPDGKPAKLWGDALDMLGGVDAEPIATLPGKFYARPARRQQEPLELRDIVLLRFGQRTSLRPVTGADKLRHLPDLLYRGFVHRALDQGEFHARASLALAGHVRFWELERPREMASYPRALDAIGAELERAGIL